METVHVIGAGLAGSEAALTLAALGHRVCLFEMRPGTATGAHLTDRPAELVCSNSLKSTSPTNAEGRLKEELAALGCHLLPLAQGAAVPGGMALVVDREKFSGAVAHAIAAHPTIELVRERVDRLDPSLPTVVATGPLTGEALFQFLQDDLFDGELFFFDAIAPIVSRASIDESQGFWGARNETDNDDYFNATLDKEQYLAFVDALVGADRVPFSDFEPKKLFERCLPIEMMAERGPDTMRFGPVSPKGLTDPRTGRWPYAAVQLRREDEAGEYLNLVGFQTRLKFGEQKRVFGMIPALKDADFERLGQMHRNTFLNAPKFLNADLSHRVHPALFFAGQVTGLEGYTSAIASGHVAARNLHRRLSGDETLVFPRETALGALLGHVQTNNEPYQPSSLNYSLFPPLPGRVKGGKQARREVYAERAKTVFSQYVERQQLIKEAAAAP